MFHTYSESTITTLDRPAKAQYTHQYDYSSDSDLESDFDDASTNSSDESDIEKGASLDIKVVASDSEVGMTLDRKEQEQDESAMEVGDEGASNTSVAYNVSLHNKHTDHKLPNISLFSFAQDPVLHLAQQQAHRPYRREH